MEKHTLKVQPRSDIGRKVKRLRQAGLLPANIYGKKIKSLSVSVNLADFIDVYKRAGETGLLELTLEGKKDPAGKRAVLISNIQLDPVSDIPIHVDFHQVDLKEKVTAAIPVEVSGESPAEKAGLGTVVTYLDEIEVEALPTDLPEKFIIDISNLSEVDQEVKVRDLKVESEKIEVKADKEAIIVKVEPPQKEEEVAPPPAEAPLEGEAVLAAEGEGKPAEGGETTEVKPEEETKETKKEG